MSSATRKLLGLVLVSAGVLIMLGGIALACLAWGLMSAYDEGAAANSFARKLMPLGVQIVPTAAIGGVLIFYGLRLRRRGHEVS